MPRPLNNPECCFICRRRACGFGVHRSRNAGWLCEPCNTAGYGPKVINMTHKAFDEIEEAALQAAGNAAGMYLDGLGKTDLAALSREEWTHFCFILVEGFGSAMRAQVNGGIGDDFRYVTAQTKAA